MNRQRELLPVPEMPCTLLLRANNRNVEEAVQDKASRHRRMFTRTVDLEFERHRLSARQRQLAALRAKRVASILVVRDLDVASVRAALGFEVFRDDFFGWT